MTATQLLGMLDRFLNIKINCGASIMDLRRKHKKSFLETDQAQFLPWSPVTASRGTWKNSSSHSVALTIRSFELNQEMELWRELSTTKLRD